VSQISKLTINKSGKLSAFRNMRRTMKWSQPIKARRPVGLVELCIPTAAAKVPEGLKWVHEIKHDGYRLIVRRSGDRVRLFTRRGYDWSDRYPGIVEAAKRVKGSFVI
jgi:ATP-dependent DNA ligase